MQISKHFTFTFTYTPFTLIHILKTLPNFMRAAKEHTEKSLSSNRPEPCRIVPLSCLIKTDSRYEQTNEGPIVHFFGTQQQIYEDAWTTVPKLPESIELSPNSWNGLHARMLESLSLAEVA